MAAIGKLFQICNSTGWIDLISGNYDSSRFLETQATLNPAMRYTFNSWRGGGIFNYNKYVKTS